MIKKFTHITIKQIFSNCLIFGTLNSIYLSILISDSYNCMSNEKKLLFDSLGVLEKFRKKKN